MEACESTITRIYTSFVGGLHFAAPISTFKTNEVELVRGVLHTLQGFSSSLFGWDSKDERFTVKDGIYVTHLSQTSLRGVLDQFMYAATCLQLVENIVTKIENAAARAPPPTLRAFAFSISSWLRRLRDVALKEEEKITSDGSTTTPTLLGLSSSLSSLCSGAEYLLTIVEGAIPLAYHDPNSGYPASEIAMHILNYLYNKLMEVCLIQGGEEDAYKMLLYMFASSLLPYIESMDSWLFEGILDDPFEEMFFCVNKTIGIEEAEFWEGSCLPRSTTAQRLDENSSSEHLASTKNKDSEKVRGVRGGDFQACPLFLQGMAKSIISAGKSLQLIQHAPMNSSHATSTIKDKIWQGLPGLTLSEIFCLSLTAFVGYGDHVAAYYSQDKQILSSLELVSVEPYSEANSKILPARTCSGRAWYTFLADTIKQKGGVNDKFKQNGVDLHDVMEERIATESEYGFPQIRPCAFQNPAMTVCLNLLHENKDAWSTLNICRSFSLPPLDDEVLRRAIFSGKMEQESVAKETNFSLGFRFGESENIRLQEDAKVLEGLFPFPTLLPSFQEGRHMSELLPFQKNSTVPSRVLSWLQSAELRDTAHPKVVLQECLLVYLKKQADYIGRNILSKLLIEWRLLDELALLRAIYLLGSGDLLQHILTVIFNKLDKGESIDDEFELNTILQESIRNSADGRLLSTPDSLVVSIAKGNTSGKDEKQSSSFISSPHRTRGQSFGVNVLDGLTFTYKVSWPLELIANVESLKKYNQVMSFLLKIRRAKFVLDKARRWMWKERATGTTNRKRHWLLEQKLLHFVDAFHQYVMDRVYHSAWHELCEGMSTAGSLDQVIEVHESYLLSIQRQSFVVPDKLWALIASRINTILGLALDFYSTTQTLCSSGTVSGIKARCEMELDRIEKDFDDCIAFLLRILSLKLNVGQFPHLADLVTRINYNYFYLSESGSLKNAPAPGTLTSKLSKAFVVKKN
ncbi:non-motor microtubule binding protein [Lithospermum erythrorhizon]|uniref:Gamma-tubulin complex component n=1 Tax=Lithospermum erythrorhizon TaxID=34254 RepID=A0AAV3Q2P3_LITER